MSTKLKKENKEKSDDPFALLPCVYEILKKLTMAETSDKDIQTAANAFMEQMNKAQNALRQTPGLELTEEEQNQKISQLEEMIRQKEQLIEECTKCLSQWG